MKYSIQIQCRDENGAIGTFIMDADRKRVSPLFDSLAELYPWMRANGWKADEYENNSFRPWQVRKFDSNPFASEMPDGMVEIK